MRHLAILLLLLLGWGAWGGVAIAEEQRPQEEVGEEKKPETGRITKNPSLKQFVDAPYPPEAFKAGIQGLVTLSIEISEKGEVLKAEVVEPAGHGFDEAAVEAAMRFLFEPAEIDGKAAPIRIIYKYGFVIEEEKVQKPAEPQPQEAGPGEKEEVNFKGRVLERGTRNPVAGIEVRAGGETAVSGMDGRFELAGVPAGKLDVVIEETGYKKFETAEEIRENELVEATYYIERESYNAFETVVRGRREKKEITRRTMQIEEVVKIPGTYGDAVKVIENMPGVAALDYTPGMLVIRGSAPEDSRAYVDGHLVPMMFHFGGWTTIINSDMLKSVDFYPGGYGVRYGRTTGGIIDVRTRAGKREGYHGYADIDIFDSSVFLEGPAGGGSFMVAARRSYIDFILPLVIPEDVLELTVAPRYYDYQAKFDYSLLQKNDFSVFGYVSDDRLSFVMPDPEEFDMEGRGSVDMLINFKKLAMNFKHRFSDKVDFSASNSVGTMSENMSLGQDIFINSDFISDFVRADLSVKLMKGLKLNVGTDNLAGYYTANVQSPLMPKEGEVPGPWETQQIYYYKDSGGFFHGAVFAEVEAKPVKRLKVIPGVRVDFYTQINRFSLDSRLTVRYGLLDGTTLKASVGQYSEPPQPDEIVKEFGNPHLKPETSLQYSAGVEQKITDAISLDASTFYKDLWNLVVTSKDPEEVRCNCGVGRIYGAEVLLRHEMSKRFFGWLAYTLSRSERKDHPGEPYRFFEWDQTHILTAIASYNLPANWTASGRFRLVSGQRQSRFLGGVYDSDYDVYWPIMLGAHHSYRMPMQHQLDLRVDKKFIFDKWILDLYLDVQNVYNKRRVEGIGYNYDYTEEIEFTGLPILPTLGLKGEF